MLNSCPPERERAWGSKFLSNDEKIIRRGVLGSWIGGWIKHFGFGVPGVRKVNLRIRVYSAVCSAAFERRFTFTGLNLNLTIMSGSRTRDFILWIECSAVRSTCLCICFRGSDGSEPVPAVVRVGV